MSEDQKLALPEQEEQALSTKMITVGSQVKAFMDSKEKKLMFQGQRYPEYEDWQFCAMQFKYATKTSEPIPVQIETESGKVFGFRADAVVVDIATGNTIGSASAYCMRDETTWRSKPTFQLASMAQTRAGAKALSNILRPVMRNAGVATTPAEEMQGESTHASIQQPKSLPSPNRDIPVLSQPHGTNPNTKPPTKTGSKTTFISEAQRKLLFARCQAAQIPEEKFRAYLKEIYNVEHTAEISWKWMDEILDWITNYDAANGGEDISNETY